MNTCIRPPRGSTHRAVRTMFRADSPRPGALLLRAGRRLGRLPGLAAPIAGFAHPRRRRVAASRSAPRGDHGGRRAAADRLCRPGVAVQRPLL